MFHKIDMKNTHVEFFHLQGLLRFHNIEVQSKAQRIYIHSPGAKWYLLNMFRYWRSLPFHKDIQI